MEKTEIHYLMFFNQDSTEGVKYYCLQIKLIYLHIVNEIEKKIGIKSYNYHIHKSHCTILSKSQDLNNNFLISNEHSHNAERTRCL
jgi:hypothetical protein